jgi:hypothetical protein
MEEWRSIGSGMLGGMSMQRPTATSVPNFDPVDLMMKKKQQQDNPQLQSTMEYNTDDMYELEEFCRKHNIIGFNCGRMNPKAALRMLKSRMGVPIEEATPAKIKSLLKG